MKQQAFVQVLLGRPQILVQVLQVIKGKRLKKEKHLEVDILFKTSFNRSG